jgi:hypothetical protein
VGSNPAAPTNNIKGFWHFRPTLSSPEFGEGGHGEEAALERRRCVKIRSAAHFLRGKLAIARRRLRLTDRRRQHWRREMRKPAAQFQPMPLGNMRSNVVHALAI